MAKRTTRNKIRWQVKNAQEDLSKAIQALHDCQDHLTQAAGLANDQSEYINSGLPVIITTLDMAETTLRRFYEGL